MGLHIPHSHGRWNDRYGRQVGIEAAGEAVSREVAEGIIIDGLIRTRVDVPGSGQVKHTAAQGKER